jgi:hypothetical protein
VIAITACSGKFCIEDTWLSEKPPISPLVSHIAPITAPSRNSGNAMADL